ncbi:MAG: dienelactone hydrolase family protein [Cyanobacteria bacterium P01_A01_bin.17]
MKTTKLCIEVDRGRLRGTLAHPEQARELIVFAHSHDIGRHCPHNDAVADALNRNGLATLQVNLLTSNEELIDLRTHNLRFNVSLLALRLREATDWLTQQSSTQTLKIGYFGTNAGAAAAFIAAADRPEAVKAIVSRSSYPNLVDLSLRRVQAPTLLIIGEQDLPALCANQDALAQIQVQKRLAVVPRATHLFEEPGTLAEAAQLANQWYQEHLVPKMQAV